MMRTQIPKFRLPETVLDEEVNYILDLKPELRLGEKITLEIMLAENYTAIFVAVARRAAASWTLPAAKKPKPISISALTGCRRYLWPYHRHR